VKKKSEIRNKTKDKRALRLMTKDGYGKRNKKQEIRNKK
jgi:hypothetical protein